MQRKDRHAGRDERDDGVFVQRIPLAEDGDVEGHHGQELAGLGEDEGDVIDMFEGGVSERRGE